MLFEKYADDYARYRPRYPKELLLDLSRKLNLQKRKLVLDLACGTCNVGRQIRDLTGATVMGLDRSLRLLKYCSGIDTVSGIAEAIPFRTGCFDVVLVGQAFHWFEVNVALDEMSRIIKPGGGLAIIWYRRKRPLSGHQLQMEKLVLRYNPGYDPGLINFDWQELLVQHGGFSEIGNFRTDSVMKYPIDDYLRLQRSKSYLGDVLSSDELKRFFEEARIALLDEYPDGIVMERMEFEYVWAIRPS